MSISKLFSELGNLFSPYVNDFEKNLAKFFSTVKESSSKEIVISKILEFLQKDLVITQVYLESRFKRYRHLGKGARRKIYQQREALKSDFLAYCDKNPVADALVQEKKLILGIDLTPADEVEFAYILQIMAYLKPGARYLYEATTSFDRLIVDPTKAKMIGDCNQIVSLYVYLMSLRFDITKLKIKLLPEHVCLHYRGVDIEATTGEFHFYEEFDAICEIHEVVSVNLLDVRDYRRSFFKISDYDFLVCARLALLLSSNQKITEQNILVSYHNLGVAATKRDDFAAAIHFFKLSRNQEALNLAYRNASIHYLQKNKLEKAKKYANLANDSDLLRQVAKKVAFLEYQKLWAKTQKYKTIDQQKRNRYTYERMYKLAKILEDQEAMASLKRLIGA